MNSKEIKELVENFPTKHKEGFVCKDIRKLMVNNFPNYTRKQFAEKLGVNTCLTIEGDVVNFRKDIELALNRMVGDKNDNK